MYSVIKCEDGSVEAVPSGWLTADKNSVYFPPTQKISSYVKRKKGVEESWFKYDCKHIKRFDELKAAREHIKKILRCNKSDVSDSGDKPLGRGHRKPAVRAVTSASSSSISSNSSNESSDLENHTKQDKSGGENDDIFNNDNVVVIDDSKAQEQIFLLQNETFDQFQQDFFRFKSEIIKEVSAIRVLIESLYDKVNSTVVNSEVSEYEELRKFFVNFETPFKHSSQLDEFIDFIQQPEIEEKAVKYLACNGGKTTYICVERILLSLLHQELALTYSLTGKASKGAPAKKSFLKTNLQNIIFRALMHNKIECTLSDVEKSIQKFLNGVKDKFGGRERRRNMKVTQESNNLEKGRLTFSMHM